MPDIVTPSIPPAAEAPAAPAQEPAAPAPAEPSAADLLAQAVAESRKWEARAKENFDKAQKYDQNVEAQKTELEKANERAAAAEQRAAAIEAENLRSRIAREHNLPADLAARLVGADEAALVADAKALQSLVTPAAPVPPTVPSIDQGARPAGNAPAQLTSADLQRMTPDQIVKAKNEGRLNDLLGIKS